jgi:hypothetical protein
MRRAGARTDEFVFMVSLGILSRTPILDVSSFDGRPHLEPGEGEADRAR